MPADAILTYDDYVKGSSGTPGAELVVKAGRREYRQFLEDLYERHQGEDLPEVDLDNLGDATVEVNAGRWVWQCPGCDGALPVKTDELVICVHCAGGTWQVPRFPDNQAEIEAELLRQPGHRLFAPIRHWKPGWTLEQLQTRTARALLLEQQGQRLVRSLSVGTTRMWMAEEILTATNMNLYISDLIDDLAGRNGPIELEDSVEVGSGSDGDRYVAVPAGTSAQRPSSPRRGMMRLNTTTGVIDLYNGTAWVQVLDTASMTYTNLSARGLVGSGASQIARGSHSH